MKRTSRSPRFVRIAARSPGRSSTGPDVARTGAPSSLAITYARVVFPSPGGPYSSTWSSASLRCRAAAIDTSRFSRTRSWPMYSSRARGRSPASYCASSSKRGEPRNVGALDRADQRRRLDARQHRQRELRTDAAHADQPLEELLFEPGGESVECQRIFADVSVHPEGDIGPGVAQHVERR